MSFWRLQTEIVVEDTTYPIRTDFRAVLDVLEALNDPDLFEPDASIEEMDAVRAEVMLRIMLKDFDSLLPEHIEGAIKGIVAFIDGGISDDGTPKPRTMDWEQDAPMIIPAINKSLGYEIRSLEYLHWHTFLGGYMEIGEGLFSQVIAIRQKKSKHKKLEKWEDEFYRQNRNLVDLRVKRSAEEIKEREELEAFFKEWGG